MPTQPPAGGWQILSKRLYILRVTLFRATARILGATILLGFVLIGFAVGGNQMYGLTVPAFSNLNNAIGAMCFIMRKPAAMDTRRVAWQRTTKCLPRSRSLLTVSRTRIRDRRMGVSMAVWPNHLDTPSPVTTFFLLIFLVSVVFITLNLYRVVIIQEFVQASQDHLSSPADDLTDDPWPTVNPSVLWKKYRAGVKEKKHKRRLNYLRNAQVHPWRRTVAPRCMRASEDACDRSCFDACSTVAHRPRQTEAQAA